MSRRRASLVATLAIVATLAAACGGAATPSPGGGGGGNGGGGGGTGGSQQNAPSAGQTGGQGGGGGSVDLCSVWTSGQVSAAVGGPAGAGTPQNDGKMCLWGDESTGADASISIDDGQGYAAACAAPFVVKVSGVGDGACFLVGGNLGTSLEFVKGGQSYEVAVQKPQVTVDWVEAAEKTLALEALPKL